MQTGSGTFRLCCSQHQVTIQCGRIEQRVARKINQNQIICLGAHKAQLAQLALDLIARRILTCYVYNIFHSPTTAFRINKQSVQAFRVGLREWQRRKVRCIEILLYANNQRIAMFHVVPLNMLF